MRAEQRPECNRRTGCAFPLSFFHAAPSVGRPTDLLVNLPAQVDFSNGYRYPVSTPSLNGHGVESRQVSPLYTHSFDVDEWTFGRPAIRGIKLYPSVDEPIAGGIVVDSDDVRRTRIIGKPQYVSLRNALRPHVLEHRVRAIDAPTKKIERQPSAGVERLPDGT